MYDGTAAITWQVKNAVTDTVLFTQSAVSFTGCMAPFVDPKTNNEAGLAVAMMQPVFTGINPLFWEGFLSSWDRRSSIYYYDWSDQGINQGEPFLIWLADRNDLTPTKDELRTQKIINDFLKENRDEEATTPTNVP